MKDKLPWLAGAVLLIVAMAFAGLSRKGQVSGHYRMVPGAVDEVAPDGTRLMEGRIELHFRPSRNVQSIEIVKLQTRDGKLLFTIPIPDGIRRTYVPGSVAAIPWSGHYNTKSPPVVVLTAKVNGEFQEVDLGIKD
ncbi:hypothetical protein OKA04_09650 [Luteolibacter flavescens]|uniref:Uncharacterized protein n=1 Tax=Luteolibacter flavescens TaxID=1859460 RepID=A0ABT3FN39_9BACT|nr:hypothetical protein [Luteolibacter flavescens]MCW1884990.1 hypothetical protein [Luteolibacter flavescens]